MQRPGGKTHAHVIAALALIGLIAMDTSSTLACELQPARDEGVTLIGPATDLDTRLIHIAEPAPEHKLIRRDLPRQFGAHHRGPRPDVRRQYFSDSAAHLPRDFGAHYRGPIGPMGKHYVCPRPDPTVTSIHNPHAPADPAPAHNITRPRPRGGEAPSMIIEHDGGRAVLIAGANP